MSICRFQSLLIIKSILNVKFQYNFHASEKTLIYAYSSIICTFKRTPTIDSCHILRNMITPNDFIRYLHKRRSTLIAAVNNTYRPAASVNKKLIRDGRIGADRRAGRFDRTYRAAKGGERSPTKNRGTDGITS